MQTLEKTESICPVCFQNGKIQKIVAYIIEDDGKIWITKVCNKHGFFKEIYFSDVNLYKKWMKYKVTGKPVPSIKTNLFDNSILYDEHNSQTILTNIVVTNRYNLERDQFFLTANKTGYVYEPSLDELKNLMQQTRMAKPVGSKSIQIIGGEPTLRDDLLKIIKISRDVGFSHIQIQTNGLKLADDIEYCQSLKREKVDTIYLNFDGVTKTTNPLIESNKKVIENCKKIHLNIVLVPTLISNKNLHEAGKIIRFAIDNIDVIKGIHFQPIFFRNDLKVSDVERQNQRVDYVNIIQYIEKEFPNFITRNDFYPISFIFPVLKFIEIFTNDPQIEISAHPGCGGSTFIFIEDGKPIPITRFLNVETYMTFLKEQTKKKGPLRKLRIASAFINNIDNFVNVDEAPHGFNLKQILKEAALGGSQYALRRFHNRYLFIGFMWHQDIWNLNIERLKRCVIHYTTFDGIVPFCSYNCLGEGEKIQKKYSISVEKWEKKNGRRLDDDFQILNK
jgi:uncharacterized radical SAM superfamily Fe-S cluster-containing enzyme